MGEFGDGDEAAFVAGDLQIPRLYVDEVDAVYEPFLNADGGVQDGAANGAGAKHGRAPDYYEGFLLLKGLCDGKVVHVVGRVAGFYFVDAGNVVNGEVSGGRHGLADSGGDGVGEDVEGETADGGG